MPQIQTDGRRGYVYCLTNKLNGKRYIGQTLKTVSRRWTEHKRNAKNGSDNALHRAIRKYGAEGFSVTTLAVTNEQTLNTLEQLFIRLYSTRVESGQGYNLTDGGDSKGSVALETRAKISAYQKGRKRSPDHIAKIALAVKEHWQSGVHSDTQRNMLKTLRSGIVHSEETKQKISETLRNRALAA